MGSDLDILVVVESSDEPFIERASSFDALSIPVPADVLVYTAVEWDQLSRGGGTPGRAAREIVWVYER